MTYKVKIILLSIICAVAAFFLGRVIWPDPEGGLMPVGVQLPLFMIISALEAIAFGIGIYFIFFTKPLLKNVPLEQKTHAHLTFWAIAWTLVSWWPHDNMHRANGMENLWGLLRIEYVFHVTLIVSAFIIGSYFVRTLTRHSLNSN